MVMAGDIANQQRKWNEGVKPWLFGDIATRDFKALETYRKNFICIEEKYTQNKIS
jgi:hypothetical protein